MKYKVFFLDRVNDFISTLQENDKVKINGARKAMELGSFELLTIKTIRASIKELIIKTTQIIILYKRRFYIFHNSLYKKE